MAKIKKARARNFCAAGKPSVGLYPHGVGGLDGRGPVIAISIGDHNIYLTHMEFDAILMSFQQMLNELEGRTNANRG